MDSYLFYDIETTGLNKAFDQVLQFAAIRTDKELNKIDEHVIYIKLRQDVIPSPMAMITHQIPISQCDAGIEEYAAFKKIHNLLNKPGTISVGYNTLGFDDEFLRFSFYRNLLTPYTHQFLKGCGRMDILPMAVMYRLYKPHVLVWPEVDGKPSMKLENINAGNLLVAGRSHDAMVDVEITLELARILYNERKMWDYLLGYFCKKTDLQRINKFPVSFTSKAGEHTYAILVDNKIGGKLKYQSLVLGLGNSIPYSNQTLWLRLDLPDLQDVNSENLQEKTWVVRKRAGEPGILLPPEKRFLSTLTESSRNIAEQNLNWLRENKKIFQEIVRFYREFSYPAIPDQDLDAALYSNGFMSKRDLVLCQKFHKENFDGKIELINKFQDKTTKMMACRLLLRNFHRKTIPDYIGAEYYSFLKKAHTLSDDERLVDYKGTKRTALSNVIKEINELTENNKDIEQLAILKELKKYLNVHEQET